MMPQRTQNDTASQQWSVFYMLARSIRWAQFWIRFFFVLIDEWTPRKKTGLQQSYGWNSAPKRLQCACVRCDVRCVCVCVETRVFTAWCIPDAATLYPLVSLNIIDVPISTSTEYLGINLRSKLANTSTHLMLLLWQSASTQCYFVHNLIIASNRNYHSLLVCSYIVVCCVTLRLFWTHRIIRTKTNLSWWLDRVFFFAHAICT